MNEPVALVHYFIWFSWWGYSSQGGWD